MRFFSRLIVRARGNILVACALLLLAGCGTSAANRRAAKNADFRVGTVYELKQEAFVLAHTGLLITVQQAQHKPVADAESLLAVGTRLAVRQVVANDDYNSGPQADVYAEIVSGPRTGRVVNVRNAALRDSATGAARRNPAILELAR